MAIKIDLEKAYDRIIWDFLENTLQEAGFNNELTRNIMGCVWTAILAVLWNGEPSKWIVPKKRVRLGDAISLYLFVLCIERLSYMI